MKLALLVMAAAVGLGAQLAQADSAEPTFDGLDKDHDGVLSKDEVAAMFPSANDSGSGGGQRRSGRENGSLPATSPAR